MTAPYTPSTVARIKQLTRTMPAAVIARELGWTMPRLGEVCRTHGIDLPITNISEERAEPLAPAPPPAPEASDLTWDAIGGVLSGNGHRITLGPAQTRMFNRLWRVMVSKGAPVPWRLMWSGAGRGQIGQLKVTLNPNLAPFGIMIDATRGTNGGYFLRAIDEVHESGAAVDAPARSSVDPS